MTKSAFISTSVLGHRIEHLIISWARVYLSIFSRRFSSEKIRLLQWLVFFRQTTDLIVYVPLFSTDFTRFTVNPATTGSSPCFSQKLFRAFAKADETEGFPLSIFSALCDFFLPSKGLTFKFFFDILQQTKVPKSPKGLPFQVFRHYETVQNSHFSFLLSKIPKNRYFLSPKGPPSILLIFRDKLEFQKARMLPLLQFQKLCVF